MTSFESMLKSPWVIAGLIGVAGAFVFKDQLCPVVKIPFICDSGGGAGSFAEDVVADCVKSCPGGALNKNCLDACAQRAAEDATANYAGYY